MNPKRSRYITIKIAKGKGKERSLMEAKKKKNQKTKNTMKTQIQGNSNKAIS